MCVGLPGRVIEIVDPEHHVVRVEVAGETHDVHAALIEDQDVEVGDWLELHMGFAMAKLTEDQAREMIEHMQALDEAHRRMMREAFGEGEPSEEDD